MHVPRFGLTPDHATPAHPAAPAGGFVACPVVLWPCPAGAVGWVHELYRRAYEEARAAVTPTWYDRAAVPSRN